MGQEKRVGIETKTDNVDFKRRAVDHDVEEAGHSQHLLTAAEALHGAGLGPHRPHRPRHLLSHQLLQLCLQEDGLSRAVKVQLSLRHNLLCTH